MKRGFLNTKRVKDSLASYAPPAVPEPRMLKAKLPIGKVEPTLSNYQASENLMEDVDANTTNYADDQVVGTTLPARYFNDEFSDYPDNVTECLFYGGKVKREILATPGFPASVPRPPHVCHSLETSAFGMGVFATRDIKMGDLIMAERPLSVTPAAIPPLDLNFPKGFNPTIDQVVEARMIQYEKLLETSISRMFPENRDALFALHNAHTEDGSGPIFGRIRTNGIGVLSGNGDPHFGSTAVFKDISRLNHSCAPNSTYNFTTASLSMQLRALRDIKQDEEITITYCGIEDSTAERQEALKPYGFQCTCRICSDPGSDARLAKIKASTEFTVRNAREGQQHAEKWLAEIETFGWQGLGQYKKLLAMAMFAAATAGRTDGVRKYFGMMDAWSRAHGGDKVSDLHGLSMGLVF
ncbi:hypothetical protein DXG03_000897 [Asterophora parasitica]|uniref:SET domain-containing protein n=1 Tax=Asterophora parasitica TaxID=117018 RepID=A0A9P7GA30_9AGAR|nr:hypothetical protein DXG03_000897 [Asterophora parasitica]